MFTLAGKKWEVSSDWLVGLTLGGYAILSIALFCFGGGSWISSEWEAWQDTPASGQFEAFYPLLVGLLVSLVGFAQIRSETIFRRTGSDRITKISLWLNAAAVFLAFSLIPLNSISRSMDSPAVLALLPLQLFVLWGAIASFCVGTAIGVLHVCWIAIPAKSAASHPKNLRR